MGIEDLKEAALVKSSNAALSDAEMDKAAQRILAAKVEGELSAFQDSEKAHFIEHLERHGNVHRACIACGVSRRSAITARQRDPLFADAWHDALEAHVDDVEEAMFLRAKNPSSQNTVAGIFLMKARRRDQYGEHLQVDHHVSGTVDIVVDLTNAPAKRDAVDAEFVESE